MTTYPPTVATFGVWLSNIAGTPAAKIERAGDLDEHRQPVRHVVAVVGGGEPGEVHPRPPDGEEHHQVADEALTAHARRRRHGAARRPPARSRRRRRDRRTAPAASRRGAARAAIAGPCASEAELRVSSDRVYAWTFASRHPIRRAEANEFGLQIVQGMRMTDMFRSVRYAARQLRQAPVFTVAAVLTLALGIGGTTAIFTLIHAVMLRSLPVADPGAALPHRRRRQLLRGGRTAGPLGHVLVPALRAAEGRDAGVRGGGRVPGRRRALERAA